MAQFWRKGEKRIQKTKKAIANWYEGIGKIPVDEIPINNIMIAKCNLRFNFRGNSFTKDKYYLAICEGQYYYEFYTGARIKYSGEELSQIRLKRADAKSRKGIYLRQSNYLGQCIDGVIELCNLDPTTVNKKNIKLTDDELFFFIEKVNYLLDCGYDFFSMYNLDEDFTDD